MGKRAKLTAARRRLRQELVATTRAEHVRQMARPEVQAFMAAADTDTEVDDIWQADFHDQVRRLDAAGWRQREQGRDGLGVWDHRKAGLRLLHSVTRQADGQVWAHSSLSRRDDHLPDWYLVRDMHRLLYPDRAGVIVIPPEAEHYSLSEVHHVWTCLTAQVLPDLRFFGGV